MTKKVSDMTRRELEASMYAGTVPGSRNPPLVVERILRELEEERLVMECRERVTVSPEVDAGASPPMPTWQEFRGMTLPVFRR